MQSSLTCPLLPVASHPVAARRSFVFVRGLIILMLVACWPQAPLHGRSKCPPQAARLTAAEYVARYGAMAQEQMRKYGVPASITLAQGMLESDYGSSYLAVVANNHFGIKAYSRGWRGETVRCDDDAESEPFCSFKSVEQGFEYHSTFLRDNTRYAPLFRLSVTDYEGWAEGLKACGYATDKQYAAKLVSLIERNGLMAYDTAGGTGQKGRQGASGATAQSAQRHPLYLTSASRRGLRYVKAVDGDRLANIALEFGKKERKLRRYNDMTRTATLSEGDIVYLQKKHARADRGCTTHVVKAGESMQKISQRYGVRLSCLLKLNHTSSAVVYEGQELRLR